MSLLRHCETSSEAKRAWQSSRLLQFFPKAANIIQRYVVYIKEECKEASDD